MIPRRLRACIITCHRVSASFQIASIGLKLLLVGPLMRYTAQLCAVTSRPNDTRSLGRSNALLSGIAALSFAGGIGSTTSEIAQYWDGNCSRYFQYLVDIQYNELATSPVSPSMHRWKVHVIIPCQETPELNLCVDRRVGIRSLGVEVGLFRAVLRSLLLWESTLASAPSDVFN